MTTHSPIGGTPKSVDCLQCGYQWSVHSKNKQVVKFLKENDVDVSFAPPLHPHFQPK